ncbi:protein kinase [bacterium]|nr:protein kinase [bacterium]
MQTGKKLGHYEIAEKIGAGGMGEVWRARDTRLGRDVALKFLPPEFAADEERLARFRREAKVLAQLHHPNIASIFGLEETDGAIFLVMELVEGDDLSDVLRPGALSIDDAISVAKQIAEGLEEAHEHGIVHRDLKPANIKRAPDGRVKILDFGLAVAMAGQSAAEEKSVSGMPTMTAAVTQAGVILGTAAYMSPEQARGLAVDRRSDIWAFGVIVFEMLTGRRLFEGETVTDTLAGILKTDPDWSSLPDNLPHQVERVIRRCLTRDPRQRLRDIGEARVRLEQPDAESGVFTGAVRPLDLPGPSRLRYLPWALLIVAVAALGFTAFNGRGDRGDTSPIQVAIPAPPDAVFQLNTSFPALPVISPDGRYVVFGARSNEGHDTQLYLRALDANQAVALDGTRNAQYPFWSPDSKWIAYFDRNEGLKKVPVNGGPDQTICQADNAKGGSWSPDGIIVFSPSFNAGLMKVSALGGEPEPVTHLEGDAGFDSHRHPWFLPDGRRFLYLARASSEGGSEIRVASIDGDSSRVLIKNRAAVEYSSGHLLFMRKQVLMAQPFDPDRVEFTGDPVTIASDVLVVTGAAKGVFSSSASGSLVYLRGADITLSASVAWMDRKGNVIEEIPDNDPFNTAVLSPDEKFIALTVYDATRSHRDIWIYEIERQFKTRFTTEGSDERYPLWSHDGQHLYYISNQDGYFKVYRKSVSGTRPAEMMLDLGKDVLIWDLSSDGRYLLISRMGDKTFNDLYVADLTGKEDLRALLQSDGEDAAARFSPDGRWITYWTTKSGVGQVCIAPWPGMEYTRQVSTESGTWQYWKGDSSELVFQGASGNIYSSTIATEDGRLKIGSPEMLFVHRGMQFDGPLIDMTADGQRFLSVMTIDAVPPEFADLIIGWPGLVPGR